MSNRVVAVIPWNLNSNTFKLELGRNVALFFLVPVDEVHLTDDSGSLELVQLDAQVLPNQQLFVETALEDALEQVVFDIHEFGDPDELLVFVLNGVHQSILGVTLELVPDDGPLVYLVLASLLLLLLVQGHYFLHNLDCLVDVLDHPVHNHREVVSSALAHAACRILFEVDSIQNFLLFSRFVREGVDVGLPHFHTVLGLAVILVFVFNSTQIANPKKRN